MKPPSVLSQNSCEESVKSVKELTKTGQLFHNFTFFHMPLCERTADGILPIWTVVKSSFYDSSQESERLSDFGLFQPLEGRGEGGACECVKKLDLPSEHAIGNRPFCLPMLSSAINMDWISYPPPFSGKTGEKAMTFRVFFRLQPSTKRYQIRARRSIR